MKTGIDTSSLLSMSLAADTQMLSNRFRPSPSSQTQHFEENATPDQQAEQYEAGNLAAYRFPVVPAVLNRKPSTPAGTGDPAAEQSSMLRISEHAKAVKAAGTPVAKPNDPYQAVRVSDNRSEQTIRQMERLQQVYSNRLVKQLFKLE